MDDDGSGQLDMAEFKKGMKELKLAELSDKAIEHLFRFFDREDSGTISYDEFLAGIRGVMNARRKALVDLAFNVLDRDGSGEVTLDDMKQAYNAKEHPEVKMKRKTENQVLLELLDGFDVGGNKDGIVTRDEFHNYYANVSGNVDSDDYFELMIRNAWHISGGEGWCQNTTNKRVLVTHADGRQTVEEIKNDMGLKANDKAGMVARLRAQGIAAAKINTNGATDESNGRGGDGSNLMQAPAMQPQQPQMPENITPYGPTETQPRTNPYYPSGTGMNAASPRISGIHVQTANRAAYPAPQPAPPATVTAPQAQRLRTGSTVVGTAGRPQLQPQQARQTAQLQVNVGTGSYNAGQPLHSSSGSVADNATALRGTLRPKSLSVMASATAPANLEQQYLPNMYQQQQQGEGYMYANQGGGVGVPYQYSEAAGGGGVGSYSTEGQLSGRRK
jgi:Ca2+-binding EF-hand superfamily protein